MKKRDTFLRLKEALEARGFKVFYERLISPSRRVLRRITAERESSCLVIYHFRWCFEISLDGEFIYTGYRVLPLTSTLKIIDRALK